MELDRGRGRDKAEGIIKQVSPTGIELRASCSSESSGIGIKGDIGYRRNKEKDGEKLLRACHLRTGDLKTGAVERWGFETE